MNIYGRQKFTTEQAKNAKKFCNGFQVDALKELKAILEVLIHKCDFSNPHPATINNGQIITLTHFLKRGIEAEDITKWSTELLPILGFSLFPLPTNHNTNSYKKTITAKVTYKTVGLVEDLLSTIQATIKSKIAKQLSRKLSNAKELPYRTKLRDDIGWGAFRLRFTDPITIEISSSKHIHNAQYDEMGFEKKTGGANKQWELLKAFAAKSGTLVKEDIDIDNAFIKRKERLSKTLKKYFKIDREPFSPYSKTNGHKTNFMIFVTDGAFGELVQEARKSLLT